MAALCVVDGANVVGSVPDGWWRDRRGAAERLRDRLADLGHDGLPGWPPPLDVVLVVEGKARGVESSTTLQVVSAPGSGDDTIVELVSDVYDRLVVVVTADRGLVARVEAEGASVIGPRTLLSATGR